MSNFSQETKKCPYCAEIIKIEAIICRFCGHDLRTTDAGKITSPDIERKPQTILCNNCGGIMVKKKAYETTQTKKISGMGCIIILLLFLIALILGPCGVALVTGMAIGTLEALAIPIIIMLIIYSLYRERMVWHCTTCFAIARVKREEPPKFDEPILCPKCGKQWALSRSICDNCGQELI